MSLQQILMATGGGSSIDPDAQAFITAAGITDGTQITAINNLVIGLKANSLWTKMTACYPMVGGTATTHKYNLVDPRDLNAAFRLAFNGGWTHTADGALPNGTTGYADTFLTPATYLTLNDEHQSFYSTTNNTPLSAGAVDMGIYDSPTQISALMAKNPGISNHSAIQMNGATIEYASTTAAGYFIGTKTAATTTTLYIDGASMTSGDSSGTRPTSEIMIGNMYFSGGPYVNGWSNQNFAFVSIGAGLSGTDAANLYTLVQTYQTTLGRQVGAPLAAMAVSGGKSIVDSSGKSIIQ